MIGRDTPAASGRIDPGFIARQRASGVPDGAIARMGGWCLTDVLAVESMVFAPILEKPKPAPPKPPAAMEIPDVAQIITHIAESYDITPTDILGHSHSAEYVPARHEAMAVVNELNRYSLAELGVLFHKTKEAVFMGIRRHHERLRAHPPRDWS